MSRLVPPPVQVAPGVFLDVFYDRSSACWYGRYVDINDHPIGRLWHDRNRDAVLINRLPTPTLSEEN